nr:hypothetical protein [Desulfosarcina cetonica]
MNIKVGIHEDNVLTAGNHHSFFDSMTFSRIDGQPDSFNLRVAAGQQFHAAAGAIRASVIHHNNFEFIPHLFKNVVNFTNRGEKPASSL